MIKTMDLIDIYFHIQLVWEWTANCTVSTISIKVLFVLFFLLFCHYCYLGADHLIFERGGGGGGVGRFRLCNNFFPPRGIRQIFFHVKVQRKIFFPNIFRGRISFLPLIITAYSRISYSYRQRHSRGFQSEEAENWIPRGWLCLNLMFPTLKHAGLLTKNV
jgi:hypothetical protein